jgi:predicted nucleotidyltransferase
VLSAAATISRRRGTRQGIAGIAGSRTGLTAFPSSCYYEQIMDKRVADDPVLTRFRAALDDIYGSRIHRVVLFGSRARGDARPDSDYDVAVFFTSLPDRWTELDRLADLRVRLIDDTGAFFDALPYVATAYRDETPLMHEIRREGLDL